MDWQWIHRVVQAEFVHIATSSLLGGLVGYWMRIISRRCSEWNCPLWVAVLCTRWLPALSAVFFSLCVHVWLDGLLGGLSSGWFR
jgi:hypothetical protein